ncbi:hypothetical protein Bca101_081071 [Brassica carinata]
MEDLQLDLDHAENCTTTIPFDLIIEILSRLPAKSLIRFQSVSKLWFSTIRSRTFVDSFYTRSMTRPRFLFRFDHRESRRNFIFSAPQYEYCSDDDRYVFSAMARYDMTISDPDNCTFRDSVQGFICFTSAVPKRFYDGTPLFNSITVYNPTTRQIVKLPDFTPNGRYVEALLGYDPVEDQYKVLCVMMLMMFGAPDESQDDIQQEHFVCTLSSSQKQEWRNIENPTGDSYTSVFFGQICIDGALYYGVGESGIVKFDVRSEKVEYIKTPEESYISGSYNSTLINYNGKLGGLERSCEGNLMTLWVLEDAEKQEWSSITYDLPYYWDATLGYGVTDGEIHGSHMVFCPPFSVFYYDFDMDCISVVWIRGIKDGDLRVDGFGELTGHTSCRPGHIENIRFL